MQVYTSPSRATTPIADLANVQIMLIGRTQDANWVYMQTKELGITGWMWAADTGINAAYITPLPVINGGGDQSEISALVPGQYNRLRAGPGFQHRVITYLHNQMVIVRGRSVDSLWLSVDANGTGGWIYRELVQIDAATVSKLPIFGTD